MAQMGQTRKKGIAETSSVHTGVGEDVLYRSAETLNKLLSDEFTLYLKARKYHWNINGPMFSDLHSFFQVLYEELDELVDEIAERVRQLGGKAYGTMSEYTQHAALKEDPGVYPNDRGMVASLLEGYEAIIRGIRESLGSHDGHGDEGTAHFLVDVMLKHEKKAWMLRSLLQGWKQD